MTERLTPDELGAIGSRLAEVQSGGPDEAAWLAPIVERILAARVASAAADAWDEGWDAGWQMVTKPSNPHRAALSVPTEAEGTS